VIAIVAPSCSQEVAVSGAIPAAARDMRSIEGPGRRPAETLKSSPDEIAQAKPTTAAPPESAASTGGADPPAPGSLAPVDTKTAQVPAAGECPCVVPAQVQFLGQGR
jgi:hypothetical protein